MSKIRFSPGGSVSALDVPEDLLYKHTESISAKLESGTVISQIGLESKLPDFTLEIGPSRKVFLHEMPQLDQQDCLLTSTAATMDCLLVFPDRIVSYNPFPVILLAGTRLSELQRHSSDEQGSAKRLAAEKQKKAA